MDKIDKLLNKIIPPIARQDGIDREWFNNEEILTKLNDEELKIVEKRLIVMLKTSDDSLIPQTLIQLKSLDSIPTMLERLALIKDPFSRITWASFIDEINNGDEAMEKIAFEELKKLEFIYEIQGVIFQDLIKFNSLRINNRIATFVNHKYFLVAQHAKEVLNLDNHKPIRKESARNRWWKFWK